MLMPFQKKVNRVIDLEKSNKILTEEEREPLEKGDKTAIAIAAAIVYIPTLAIICGLICGVAYLLIK